MKKHLFKLLPNAVAVIPAIALVLTVFHNPGFAAPNSGPRRSKAEKKKMYDQLVEAYKGKDIKDKDKKNFTTIWATMMRSSNENATKLIESFRSAQTFVDSIKSNPSLTNISPEKLAFRFLKMPEGAKVLGDLLNSKEDAKTQLAQKIIKITQLGSLEELSKNLSEPSKTPDLTELQIDALLEISADHAKWISEERLFYALSKVGDADPLNIKGYSDLLEKILNNDGATLAEKIQNTKEELDLFKKILKCK